MSGKVIGNLAIVILLIAGITAPLLVWRSMDQQVQAKDENLRRQKELIDELGAANTERKKRLSGKNSAGLTDEQIRELLRLRAEAGALRRQTNDVTRLRAENEFLQTKHSTNQSSQPKNGDEQASEMSGELIGAAKTILAELPAAQQRYAQEHQGQPAGQLSALRKYFPMLDGKRMPGLYSLEFVREGGPQPGDTLILGEFYQHPDSEGFPVRIYAFSDGQTAEVKGPPDGDVDKFFRDWEKQHLNPALSQGQ